MCWLASLFLITTGNIMKKQAPTKVTKEKIEKAISDGYICRQSVAKRLLTTIENLMKYAKLHKCEELLPPGQLDIHHVRYLMRWHACRTAKEIQRRVKAPMDMILKVMVENGLDPDGRDLGPKVVLINTGTPAVSMEKPLISPEIRRCEMKRNERLDAQFAASISAG
jgi:hypothetical protein